MCASEPTWSELAADGGGVAAGARSGTGAKVSPEVSGMIVGMYEVGGRVSPAGNGTIVG